MVMMLEERSVVDYLLEVTGSVDISSTEQTLWRAYNNAATRLSHFTSRSLQPLSSHYSQQGSEVHTVIFILGHHLVSEVTIAGVQLVYPKIIAPLPTSYILDNVPPHASRVFVLEQLQEWPTKWTTFYMEVVRALQQRHCMIRRGVLGYDKTRLTDSDLTRLLSPESDDRVQLGSPLPSLNLPTSMSIPKHESSYLEVLKRLFDVRFEHSNSPDLVPTHGRLAMNPEFALGRVRGQVEERARLQMASPSR
ncbi:hypothetical protein F5878DRAFT_668240 [Lentinula raphanica]|uniref:Uncharacterized protein n=1 Tax=Lentinula raphanica TaxID=153919 RepID=A0AA38NUH9_9AGAR|nr:hypothetical protein F5878DRAFT_668240 [Lentinula raphanica]